MHTVYGATERDTVCMGDTQFMCCDRATHIFMEARHYCIGLQRTTYLCMGQQGAAHTFVWELQGATYFCMGATNFRMWLQVASHFHIGPTESYTRCKGATHFVCGYIELYTFIWELHTFVWELLYTLLYGSYRMRAATQSYTRLYGSYTLLYGATLCTGTQGATHFCMAATQYTVWGKAGYTLSYGATESYTLCVWIQGATNFL